MSRYKKGSAETITFICDNIKCGKERTILKSRYKGSDKHFCSRKCFGEYNTRPIPEDFKSICLTCGDDMDINDYLVLSDGTISRHCKLCRAKKRDEELLLKKSKQREFAKKWNKTFLL